MSGRWALWALRAGHSTVDQSMLTYLDGPGTTVEIPHDLPQPSSRDDTDEPTVLGDAGGIQAQRHHQLVNRFERRRFHGHLPEGLLYRRIVVEVWPEPALDFGDGHSLAACVVRYLIAIDLAEAEVLCLRVRKV